MAQGKAKPVTRLRVLRTERLTPSMIRVVAGGPGLAAFEPSEYADSYVKMVFLSPGVDYPEPFDQRVIRETMPQEHWPRLRTYTVRQYDASAGELALDFVCHGDEGLGGPWAKAAKPGDELLLLGPGGGYAPDDAADWHLLAGDESALPAIAVALEQLPPGAAAHVFLEVAGPQEQQPLATKADAQIHWLYREAGDDIVAAVREFEFPNGQPQAFVHGEAGFVRELRRHLLAERGVAKDRLSVSGYWRKGKDDEGWRAEKAAEKARADAAG